MATVRPVPARPAVPQQATRFQLPIRNEKVSDLLLWRDPVKSGVVLTLATLAFAFLRYAKFNAIVVTAYTLVAIVIGSFAWNSYAQFANKAPVPVPEVLKRGVTEQEVQAVAQRGTVLINRVLGFLKRVLHLTDPIATGQTAAALYAVARIAGLVSPVTLAFVLVLLAFTLPKIYELRKPQIDDAVATLKVQATRFYDQYLSRFVTRIPRAANADPIEIIDKKST
ncbi:hypothetical protein ACKKBF_B14225 [Auxenochlorella protothecoides x Auxenochlorella symbiontica]